MVDIIIYPNFPDWKPRHREIIHLAQDYTVPVVINYISKVSAQFGSKIHVLNNEPNLASSVWTNLATSTAPHFNTHTYTHLLPLPTVNIVVSLLGVKSAFGVYYYSVQFSRSVMSDSLRPHESQRALPPCPSPIPRVYSNACPSSR